MADLLMRLPHHSALLQPAFPHHPIFEPCWIIQITIEGRDLVQFIELKVLM